MNDERAPYYPSLPRLNLPDFDRIARRLSDRGSFSGEIAEELRRIWNARGAADIAALETALLNLTTVRLGAMKTFEAALKDLDH